MFGIQFGLQNETNEAYAPIMMGHNTAQPHRADAFTTRKDTPMQRSATRFSRSVLCCTLPALCALPAVAGTPAALDRVPTDAQAVIVVPDLGDMLNDINAINAMLGDQGEPMINMVTAMIRGMPGINLEGSMADRCVRRTRRRQRRSNS